MSKKQTKYNFLSWLLIVIAVVCIGVSIHGLYGIYKDYKEADDIYGDAENEFVQEYDPQQNITTEVEETEVLPPTPWYELASVDLKGLQNKYADIVGWIYFEDGLISYPVVQADDNDTYLYTTYNGKQSKAGSIFVEAAHSGDFTDTHTIIYGHNMKNLSMFGRLKHFKTKKGYYDEHAYFQIFHGDEILRYQIFAYRDVAVDSFVYHENFTSAKELSNRLLKGSYVNPKLNIEDDDRIITLSTCTGDDAHRFVVSAVLVERYNLLDHTLTAEIVKEQQ